MPLLERLSATLTVDFHQFAVVDRDGANGQPEGDEDPFELGSRANAIDWLLTTGNFAIICSREYWHVIDVTVELWDEPPPPGDQRTATLYSSSGILHLVGSNGRPSRTVVNLRSPARSWVLGASVRPGSGARHPEDGPPEGLETWRLRFWPAS